MLEPKNYTTKTKFYHYRQNNSFGRFDQDKDLDVNVYIEATDIDQANDIAFGLGIYFNGCREGIDCSCCGDRWTQPYTEPIETKEELQSSIIANIPFTGFSSIYAIIHTLDKKRYTISNGKIIIFDKTTLEELSTNLHINLRLS